MKKEVEDAQTELKQWKQEANTTNREITLLKKEQAQLQATLKRYWKLVQGISTEKYSQKRKDSKAKNEKYSGHKRVETKAGAQFNSLGNQYTMIPGPQRAFTQADPLKGKTHHR